MKSLREWRYTQKRNGPKEALGQDNFRGQKMNHKRKLRRKASEVGWECRERDILEATWLCLLRRLGAYEWKPLISGVRWELRIYPWTWQFPDLWWLEEEQFPWNGGRLNGWLEWAKKKMGEEEGHTRIEKHFVEFCYKWGGEGSDTWS